MYNMSEGVKKPVKKKDTTTWSNYGRVVTSSVTYGYDKYLYNKTKNIERITDTNNYITKSNNLINTLLPDIDKIYKEIMDNKQLKDVPMMEKDKIAIKIAHQHGELAMQLVEELYPDTNKALAQTSHISEANDVIAGNIGVKNARKPRKSTKAPKKSTKKSSSGKKRGRPAGSANKKKKGV
jgi:hypothetical protein